MTVYVLLLDKEEKLYNYFPNNDDGYWKLQVDKINDERYECHYFNDEESLLNSHIIKDDYKIDSILFLKILQLSCT